MKHWEKLGFITEYSISHGRQAIIRNATYLAKQLGLTKAEVISNAVPDTLTEFSMFGGNPDDVNDELYYMEVATYRDFLKSEAGKIHQKKLALQVKKAVTKIVSAPRTNIAQASRAPKKPASRATRTSAKSGDSDPDPEPEPPRQLLYTFKSFAQLVDCSEKTLRNKVSAGLFPQPQKTAFGPRFTKQHLDFAVTPPAKPARGRGRPRIADLVAGGVQ